MKFRRFLLILVFLVSVTSVNIFLFHFKNNKKLMSSAELGVMIIYQKRLFGKPVIELRKLDGTLLESQAVGDGVKPEDIEVHVVDDSIVVLPGDTDWVWKCESHQSGH